MFKHQDLQIFTQVLDRGRETQLQVGENLNYFIERFNRVIIFGSVMQINTININSTKLKLIYQVVVVVVNLCFTSLFGTKGLLSDIVIR